ncbi:hypothetical protein ASD53_00370 [Lysobacter sp. Root559]|nr:hypothetical protein ASD53_00370 [Lysobacter sp. Root559]
MVFETGVRTQLLQAADRLLEHGVVRMRGIGQQRGLFGLFQCVQGLGTGDAVVLQTVRTLERLQRFLGAGAEVAVRVQRAILAVGIAQRLQRFLHRFDRRALLARLQHAVGGRIRRRVRGCRLGRGVRLHRTTDTAGGQLLHQFRGQRLQPALVAGFAIGQAVGAAVDRAGGLGHVLAGVLRHIVLPVPGRDAGRVLGLGREIGVVHQVQAQRFAGGAVIVLAGQLHVAATAVFVAVAGLVVAHATAVHQVGQRLRTPAQGFQTRRFQRRRAFAHRRLHRDLRDALGVAKALFELGQAVRLVTDLGHEVRQFATRGDPRRRRGLQQLRFPIRRHV